MNHSPLVPARMTPCIRSVTSQSIWAAKLSRSSWPLRVNGVVMAGI
ncbi:MAG: hypothetical protein U1D06_07770 [Paracoccaceae bacterium]|nr:hypothetical protein [Paracoccaceae bacterium]